jgi:hypothetical protein
MFRFRSIKSSGMELPSAKVCVVVDAVPIGDDESYWVQFNEDMRKGPPISKYKIMCIWRRHLEKGSRFPCAVSNNSSF